MHDEHRRDLLKTGGAVLAAGVLSNLGWHARAAAQGGRTKGAQGPSAPPRQAEKTPIVAVGSDEGVVRWLQPDSAQELGSGALLNIKIDRLSVPHTTMMVATQKLAASGIPVHSHTWEDEMIYVIKGRGFAIINEEQTSVPIDTGSVLYIPIGEWHGLKNADPKAPMDILLVTTPVKPSGLGDFFRFATVQPGHPPLNLPEEEFLKLVRQYGMEVPTPQ
jgi:mannose-6-phosphate isomerase-like protein (cupin superfamily)